MTSDNNILVIASDDEKEPVKLADLAIGLRQIADVMQTFADTARMTNERITMLERQVALLTKVTSMQARELNAAIRARAAELAVMYTLPGCEATLANAIRRDVRMTAGVSSMRELPRCEFRVYMQRVEMWDDYKTLKAIRKRVRGDV